MNVQQTNGPEVEVKLPKRVTRSFVVIVVVATAVLAMLTVVVVSNRNLARQGDQAHDGLCALKTDLRGRVNDTEARITTSRDYLRDHPAGAPGIPVSLIKASIASQQAMLAGQRSTLDALNVITCPEGGSS